MTEPTNHANKVLDRITDAIIALDNDNVITYINYVAEAFWKKPKGELAGKNIWQTFPEEVGNDFYNYCEEARLKQHLITNQKFRIQENGWFELNIYPALDGLSIFIRKIISNDRLQKQLNNATEEIKKSSERFELVTRATNDMIWDWDFTTNEVWWNYNFNNFFGYDKQTSHHHISSWINNVHEEDRKRVVESIYGVINSGEKYWTDEYRYLKKDGTVLNIYDRGYVSHDDTGKPLRMIGSMLNISERISAEKALKNSEEKYRTLVEQASDAIFITDKSGSIHTVNTSACKLTQCTEAELLKMNLYGFIFPEDIVKTPFRFEQLEMGKAIIVERTIKIKNGLPVQIESSSNMLSDGRVLIFARDISERIKSQNEIIKEKDFSESIINSLPGIFYLHDINGKILKWNKNVEIITGYNYEEISNMYPLNLYVDEERALMKQKAIDVFNNGSTEVDCTIVAKNKNSIPFHIVGRKVMFEEKPCLIAIGIDATEKRKAETLLTNSYNDVRRLATHITRVREEERKRIGREIHDELGQQLTAIKMDVVWIDKKIADDNNPIKNNLKNILEIINGSNQSVRRILNELSPGVIDNFGLLEALEQQNQQFYSSTGIKIDFITSTSEINLSQDIANTIFRVYQESLTNIIRYAQASIVEATLKLSDKEILISVMDNGKGFNTTRAQSKKSFGILGMKERVLSHNGNFELHSEPEVGTRITFSLPHNQ
jgi:PAS domain S-box-containing protein